jgi:hypothetical protein
MLLGAGWLLFSSVYHCSWFVAIADIWPPLRRSLNCRLRRENSGRDFASSSSAAGHASSKGGEVVEFEEPEARECVLVHELLIPGQTN